MIAIGENGVYTAYLEEFYMADGFGDLTDLFYLAMAFAAGDFLCAFLGLVGQLD